MIPGGNRSGLRSENMMKSIIQLEEETKKKLFIIVVFSHVKAAMIPNTHRSFFYERCRKDAAFSVLLKSHVSFSISLGNT